jgi:hypothetical protein
MLCIGAAVLTALADWRCNAVSARLDAELGDWAADWEVGSARFGLGRADALHLEVEVALDTLSPNLELSDGFQA